MIDSKNLPDWNKSVQIVSEITMVSKDSLAYRLKGLMSRNKDGSFSTQANRAHILVQAAKQLKEGGFRNMIPESIKPKHVEYLLGKWTEQELSAGTIKNRMAHVRWWAEKVGKSSMLPKSNTGMNASIDLNIEQRSLVATVSKARELDAEKLAQIKDKYVKLSLKLQREFGLRREEAIKFTPSYAVQGDKLQLKASWTKGGRAREIPIRTQAQRALIAEVNACVVRGALIPANRNYIKQVNVYKAETQKVGMDFNHGLRHCYAQARYLELTGWKCPGEGGLSRAEMTREQREVDKEARLTVSRELGHTREQITNSYLGS